MSEPKRSPRVDMTLDVIDAFEPRGGSGLAVLVERSATLDASVPLRAAQACVPFLSGNAFGLQLKLTRGLTIEHRFRGARLLDDDGRLDAWHAATIPMLRARGHVTSSWGRAFARGLVYERRGVLHLFTGLLVRPPDGTWLRISSNANRRSFAYDIDEVFVPDGVGFVPLVLPIRPRVAGVLKLEGEIATLALLRPDLPIERATLADAPEIGEAHAHFYDANYFAVKKGESTRKYRKLVARSRDEEGEGRSRVIEAGPVSFRIERRDAILGATSPVPARATDRGVTTIAFDTLLPFDVTFDGLSLLVRWDQERLAREARALEQTWSAVYGDAFLSKHRGAILYLTKYFTPHPPGEPHFFVKPWAFVHTPPGFSSLIEGARFEGLEVMRGVVETDSFHATPAVFRVLALGARLRVREGAHLCDVVPFPRALGTMRVRTARWD